MTAVAKQPIILLNCLERFEKQACSLTERCELIELFCRDIIPFLEGHEHVEPVRNEWRFQRDLLNQRAQETEKVALAEVQDVFRKVKAAIVTPHEVITQKIAHIEDLITGREKQYGSPVYRILYNELKQLFHLLLEAGAHDLCEPYAKLAHRKKYAQKDSGYELVEEVYIEEFSFAPSVIDAYAVMDAMQCSKDPAVVWWYFEYALWCWRTPESYFTQAVACKNSKDNRNLFQVMCEHSAWSEIASVRDHTEVQLVPVVFTKELFQNGFSVLINAISAHVSHGAGYRATQAPVKPVTTFELKLEGNELWVKAVFENRSTEKFYIQQFHEEAGGEESALFKFVKGIFNDPQAGEKRVRLRYKWESASKHINRLKLPPLLKEAFFGKSSSSTFQFKGLRVELSDPDGVVKALREHNKA